MGYLEPKALSGTVIEAIHGKRDVPLRDAIECHFLWEELSNQIVHILIRTALS
jgi:hypothetical protein